MEFGGHVAYTAGGFKCHPFGTDEIRAVISNADSELDIPQAFELRPLRAGFRRSVLKSSGGQAVVYTAFIGISEPNVRRLGSFLAIGIATSEEMDSSAARLGSFLSQLLRDLVARVSEGSRFVDHLDVNVINDFLRDKFAALDEIRSRIRPWNRIASAAQFRRDTIFLAERNDLPTAFDQICAVAPPQGALFVLENIARADLHNARHLFGIESWPLPENPIESKISQAGKNKLTSATTASVPKESDRTKPRDLVGDGSSQGVHSQLRQIEDMFASQRRLAGVSAIALAGVLLLSLMVAYWLHSSSSGQIADLQQQIAALRAQTAPAKSETAENQSGFQPTTQSARDQTMEREHSALVRLPQLIQLPRAMDLAEIRKIYCPRKFASDSAFEHALYRFNARTVVPSKGEKVRTNLLLPVDCDRRG